MHSQLLQNSLTTTVYNVPQYKQRKKYVDVVHFLKKSSYEITCKNIYSIICLLSHQQYTHFSQTPSFVIVCNLNRCGVQLYRNVSDAMQSNLTVIWQLHSSLNAAKIANWNTAMTSSLLTCSMDEILHRSALVLPNVYIFYVIQFTYQWHYDQEVT